MGKRKWLNLARNPEEKKVDAKNKAQAKEALGSKNKYYTAEKLNKEGELEDREATPLEARMHFALYGGAKDFNERLERGEINLNEDDEGDDEEE